MNAKRISPLWVAGCGATLAQAGFPAGLYRNTCMNSHMQGTTLMSTCKDFFGNKRQSSLAQAAACKDIRNVNGDLRCVVSSKHATGSHAIDFDVVSLTDILALDGVETKQWRIDNPQVWSDTNDLDAQYPEIAIKPGDAVHAGGCVQTGGSGKTWKSSIGKACGCHFRQMEKT